MCCVLWRVSVCVFVDVVEGVEFVMCFEIVNVFDVCCYMCPFVCVFLYCHV